MTIREALSTACTDLKAAGIDTPSLDASLLLANVLNTSRTTLLAAADEPLHEDSYAAFRALIQRRRYGECTAYILGKKEFRGLDFAVNPSVLVPRPDTETLVEAALEIIRKEILTSPSSYVLSVSSVVPPCNSVVNLRILDLCTGSGAVAIALKNEIPELEVHASDISSEALATAKTNAARLLPHSSQINFYQGDLYNALPQSLFPTPLFSLIVSNPPYIPTEEISTLCAEVQNEPHIALDGGERGLSIIERIIDGAPQHLLRGGCLLMEADPRQMKDISILLEQRGFVNVKLYKDLSGQERVIGGVFEKD